MSLPQISKKNPPKPGECEKWMKNKKVNPRNGRPISTGGRIEKQLKETCKEKQFNSIGTK